MTDAQSPEMQDERASSAKRPKRALLSGLAAIVFPAFLAGLFAIIPNVFEKVSAEKARLTYSVIASPAIKVGSSYNRIFSLTLENVGSTKLTGVFANISLSGGEIVQSALEGGSGDQPRIQSFNEGSQLSVRSLFPKERVSIVVLARVQFPTIKPSLSVRSEEVLGTQRNLEDNSTTDESGWLVVLPALGALLASLIVIARLKSVNGSMTFSQFVARGIASGQLPHVIQRAECINYINSVLRDEQVDTRMTPLRDPILYIQYADILLDEANRATRVRRKRLIAAMKSLLVVPSIADDAAEIVRSYLRRLGADDAAERGVEVDRFDRVAMRREIANVFKREGVPLVSGKRSRSRFIKIFSRSGR